MQLVGVLLGGEVERVGLVEDDDGVRSFVFGHVAGGDEAFVPHPAEGLCDTEQWNRSSQQQVSTEPREYG